MEWIRKLTPDGIGEFIETTYFGKKHYLVICESRYMPGRYHMYYYINDLVEIKEAFDAGSLDEAKKIAMDKARTRITRRIEYWQWILSQLKEVIGDGKYSN